MQKRSGQEFNNIPDDWKVTYIYDLCNSDKNAIKPGPFGSSLKKECYVGNGYKVYGQEQVISNDFNIGDYYIDESKYQELKGFTVKPNDMLISLVGTYGRIAIAPDNIEQGIINPRLLKISFNPKIANVTFFKYYMISELFIDQLKRFSHGGTMKIINATAVKKSKYILPPLPEQKKIADILSTVDQQIEQTDAIIEKIKELKKGLMQHLLTRGIGHTEFKKTEVGEIPAEWEVKKMDDVHYFISRGKGPEYVEKSQFKVVNQKCIRWDTITEEFVKYTSKEFWNKLSNQYKLKKDDILLNSTGTGTLGRCNIFNKKGNYLGDSHTTILRTKEDLVEPNYVMYFLQSREGQKNVYSCVTGSTNQIELSRQQLKNMKLPIPTLSEQKTISNILYSVDFHLRKLDEKKGRLHILKKGLMQKLLTGQIRVKVSEEG